MKELITNKDFAKTDGFIVRSLPNYTGITIHTPRCTKLSIDFINNLISNKPVSERTHQFHHVETLEEARAEFEYWWKQPNSYCQDCNPQRGINDQT